jgi:hypothetical protein
MADKFNLDGFAVDEDNNLTVDGNVTAVAGVFTSVSGAITGRIITPDLGFTSTTYVVNGAISTAVSYAKLDASSASTVMTIAAPTDGEFRVITCVDASNTCTVTCTAGDFDGAGGNVATFDAAEETLVLFGVSATRYVIIENIGGVVLS